MIPVISPMMKTTPRIQMRESIPVLGSVSTSLPGAVVTDDGAVVTEDGAVVTEDGAVVTEDGAVVTEDGAEVVVTASAIQLSLTIVFVSSVTAPLRASS